jgi:hypothetical protein
MTFHVVFCVSWLLFAGLRLSAKRVVDTSPHPDETCVFPCLYFLKLNNIADGNEFSSHLRVHHGHKVIDAVADYVWRHELDNSAVDAVLQHVCSNPEMRDRVECVATQPSTFMTFMLVPSFQLPSLPPDSVDIFPRLTVREGYNVDDTVRLYCLQFGCSDEVYQHLMEQVSIELNHGDKTDYLQRQFEKAYEYKIWAELEDANEGILSGGGSGPGSGKEATEVVRRALAGQLVR